MKKILIITGLILISCKTEDKDALNMSNDNDRVKINEEVQNETSNNFNKRKSDDVIIQNSNDDEIFELVNSVYEWVFDDQNNFDLNPFEKNDSMYMGIDNSKLELNIKALNESKLFTDNFIKKIKEFYLNIDIQMREDSIGFYLNDILPFFSNGNPFCNCQDIPDFPFVNSVEYRITHTSKNKINFFWKWNSFGNDEYHLLILKSNKHLLIESMEGFEEAFYPNDQISD